jgi:hypothetical protein
MRQFIIISMISFFVFLKSQSTNVLVTCPDFNIATSTNSAAINTVSCSFQACPGTTLLISGCNSVCSGDQYIRLYQTSSGQVAFNDDGGVGCGYCSAITYLVVGSSCQTYTLAQGCYNSNTCSGRFIVSQYTPTPTASPTLAPSIAPSRAPSSAPQTCPTFSPSKAPTFAPSSAPTGSPTMSPTFVPSQAPTYAPTKAPAVSQSINGVVTCSDFNIATSTNFAAINTVSCSFQACPGTTLLISGCNSVCSGDQYIRLYQTSSGQVASNDDGGVGCGYCSAITYLVVGSSCQTYTLAQGCYNSNTCSGRFIVSYYTPTTISTRKVTYFIYYILHKYTLSF